MKPLGPLRHFELDLVALGQALEALGLDGAVVDEDILSALDLDEPVPLCVVESFDRALCHTSVPSLLGGDGPPARPRATMAGVSPRKRGEQKKRH